MAEIQAIYQAMARMAPPELAESWDNVGLLVDCGRPAARALTALDITPEVVEEARQLGCGVIVAHHPVIFSPLKRLDCRDVAFLLVQAGISALCMPPNLDAAAGGGNGGLAGVRGIRGPGPLSGGCGRGGGRSAGGGDNVLWFHRHRRSCLGKSSPPADQRTFPRLGVSQAVIRLDKGNRVASLLRFMIVPLVAPHSDAVV